MKQEGTIQKMPDREKIDFSMFLDAYLSDTKEGFQKSNAALLALEKDYTQLEQLDEVFRNLHTLKSSSAMLEFAEVSQLAHIGEDLLDRLRKQQLPLTPETINILFELLDELQLMVKAHAEGKGVMGGEWETRIAELKNKLAAQGKGKQEQIMAEGDNGPSSQPSAAPDSGSRPVQTSEKIQTVRVNVELLDSLFNLVGEIIITKNRIDSIVSGVAGKELKAALAAMERLISEMQEDVSTARLVPVNEIFQKYPRMVRDLARDAGKEIELIIEGGDLELDKGTLDTISEPLIHLLRNAVGHGIEHAETRQQMNKPKEGTIKLTAKRAENYVLIIVEDDGRGVDAERLKKALVTTGRIKPEEVESLGHNDILKLLFEPGVTSAEGVTNLSGRGVGLDVVRTAVRSLGGRVDVVTEKDKGTTFTLQLPLSTAVMQTLMVGVGQHVFAIPSDIVMETLEVKPQDIKQIDKERALVLRQEVIPFAILNEVLDIPRQQNQENLVAVITRWGSRSLALAVDLVIDQRENIIKPLDHIARQFGGLSGGIILGDGSVALLLDIPSLFDEIKLKEKEAILP
jgi:two-component system chemotaxis sensor kinase CheA